MHCTYNYCYHQQNDYLYGIEVSYMVVLENSYFIIISIYNKKRIYNLYNTDFQYTYILFSIIFIVVIIVSITRNYINYFIIKAFFIICTERSASPFADG